MNFVSSCDCSKLLKCLKLFSKHVSENVNIKLTYYLTDLIWKLEKWQYLFIANNQTKKKKNFN